MSKFKSFRNSSDDSNNLIPQDFRRHLEEYINYLDMEKGRSQNTIASYSNDIIDFFYFLDEIGVKSIQDITDRHLLDYRTVNKDKLSPRTVSRRLIALRGFFNYLVAEGRLSSDITLNIELPTMVKRLPEHLRPEEVEAMLNAVDTSTSIGARDRAILEVIYATGMRVSEVSDLRINHVFFDAGFVRVIGKGNKERVIPMNSTAVEWLQMYVQKARPALLDGKQSEFLFVNQFGNALSRQWIWNIVKNAAKLAGINKNVKPHTLRHTFATQMLEGNADLRSIQVMMGHADISSTQVYTHVTENTKKTVYDKAHPHAKSSESKSAKASTGDAKPSAKFLTKAERAAERSRRFYEEED